MFASGFRNPFRFSIDPKYGGTPVCGRCRLEQLRGSRYRACRLRRRLAVLGRGPRHAGLRRLQGVPGLLHLQSAGQPERHPQGDNPLLLAMSLYEFPHFYNGASQHSAAVVGGVFYSGTSYPAAYRGSDFFGDYPPNSPSRIFSMATDGATVHRAPESNGFGEAIGGPVSFKIGPGGDVYFADITTSTDQPHRVHAGESPTGGERNQHQCRPDRPERLHRRYPFLRP